ncbi:MAG: glycosyltransferase family 2 protein [Parachlamydia sp.]|nr:glycosyltransferase family 2 protein [Parachlamydia sp.]
MNISVTILTKNSQKYLQEVLASLKDFDEVLLFDNGSTDRTFEIAASFPNVKPVKGTFDGFGPTHNKASALAKWDWILSIDSDEVVTSGMAADIASTLLDPGAVYAFPRHNYFNGTFIKWCGWYPDKQIRLYNRTRTRFTDAQVHEAIMTEGMHRVDLKGALRHYSYDTHADFLAKMQSYSDLFARQYCGRRSSSPWKALWHGIGAFMRAYIIKLGFLGGYEGFVISVYNGNTAYYKYLKLYEANQRKNER